VGVQTSFQANRISLDISSRIRFIVPKVVVVLPGLVVVILPREPQVIPERPLVVVRVLNRLGPPEGIRGPLPDYLSGPRFGNRPRRAQVVGVDVVHLAVAHRGDGEVAQPDGLLDRPAIAGVLAQKAPLVVGEQAVLRNRLREAGVGALGRAGASAGAFGLGRLPPASPAVVLGFPDTGSNAGSVPAVDRAVAVEVRPYGRGLGADGLAQGVEVGPVTRASKFRSGVARLGSSAHLTTRWPSAFGIVKGGGLAILNLAGIMQGVLRTPVCLQRECFGDRPDPESSLFGLWGAGLLAHLYGLEGT